MSNNSDDDLPPLTATQLRDSYDEEITDLELRLTTARDLVTGYSNNQITLLRDKFNLAISLRKSFAKLHTRVCRLNATLDADDKLDLSQRVKSFDEIIEVITVKYYQASDSAAKRLAVKTNLVPSGSQAGQNIPSPGGTLSNNAFQFPASNQYNYIKLPPIQVPTFNNSIKDFPRFFELFSAVYGDSNPNLTSVQRLYYLRSLTSGEAQSLVSQFPLTENGYIEAIKALKARFQCPRTLSALLMQEILQFTPAKKASHESLKKFLETHHDNVTALKAMPDIPDLADFLLISIALTHLDPLTRKLFEASVKPNCFPQFSELVLFCQKQLQTFELIDAEKPSMSNHSNPSNVKSLHTQSQMATTDRAAGAACNVQKRRNQHPSASSPRLNNSSSQSSSCIFCNGNHKIFKCAKFINLPLADRTTWVQSANRCNKCLHSSHLAADCASQRTCFYCSSNQHSSVLCCNRGQQNRPPGSAPATSSAEPVASTSSATSLSCALTGTDRTATDQPSDSVTLLGTITAQVTDHAGFIHEVTCILDTGSQCDLISQAAAERLSLQISQNNISTITGVGNASQKTLGETFLTLCSRFDKNVKLSCTACILPILTGDFPAVPVQPKFVQKLKNMQLADKNPFDSKNVDIILGAASCVAILKLTSQLVPCDSDPDHMPSLLHSKFGAILIGKVPIVSNQSSSSALFTCTASASLLSIEDLNSNMEKFFESDGIPDLPKESIFPNPDDIFVEKHFSDTHQRGSDGTFIVKLPFRPEAPQIGNNRIRAFACFHKMENRLYKSNDIDTYRTALLDYVHKGQMVPSNHESPYLFNQHVVIKRSSGKAKLVFDPTLKSPGCDFHFNNTLFTGPQLLRQLNYILLAVRKFPIALAADIETFYRSISVDESSQQRMHILVRKSPEGPIAEYALTHLPYGLTCSPFLALRCLHELANTYKHELPLAADAIYQNSYMDDFFLGCDSDEESISVRTELKRILSLGNFKLGKFYSNSPAALKGLEPSELGTSNLDLSTSDSVPILGLLWQPTSDCFVFQVGQFSELTITRRTCTSYLAKLYDSLGLLHPTVFWLKCFIQNLWHEHPNLGWDTVLPASLLVQWVDFTKQMPLLSQIQIPRYCSQTSSLLWLAVFSDASEKGYAFCAYLVSFNPTTHGYDSHLLFAKSKLAPKRVKRTIPQLELAALELASKGVKWFLDGNLPFSLQAVHFFSDSEIALAYLKIPVHKLKVYTANRVSNTLDLKNHADCFWHHCSSDENPADLACRGLEPSLLIGNELWFQGPLLLRENFPPPSDSESSTINVPTDSLNEVKKSVTLSATTAAHMPSSEKDPCPIIALTERLSTYTAVQRTMAFVLRFINNCKNKLGKKVPSAISEIAPLSVSELRQATIALVKAQQAVSFANEISQIIHKKYVSKQLQSLTPFLDTDDVLRVGGRLSNAYVGFDTRHPMILPRKSALSTLICRYYHACTAHSGSTFSLAMSRQQFWIISGRALMRSVVYNCVICAKLNPRSLAPAQGDLPSFRTSSTSGFAFRNEVGVDAFGPYNVKLSTRRNSGTSKIWGLLFLCLQTRAVHIEIISSMSTKAFLAAFDRFAARRGLPARLHSDNAGSFVAGAKHLSECAKFLKENFDSVLSALACKNVQFTNTPPYTPWMGGWEPLIKLAKKTLKTLLDSRNLYFEEFVTLFAKTESILNSRPYLEPSSDAIDPTNLLCPGSFIVGGPLILPPDLPDSDSQKPENISNRYDRLRVIIKKFWHSWHRDVLNTLMQKNKWPRGSSENITTGQLVWIRDDTDSLPGTWPLAIVTKTYPDASGCTRVVDVRSASGVHRRAVRKLVLLPIHN